MRDTKQTVPFPSLENQELKIIAEGNPFSMSYYCLYFGQKISCFLASITFPLPAATMTFKIIFEVIYDVTAVLVHIQITQGELKPAVLPDEQ